MLELSRVVLQAAVGVEGDVVVILTTLPAVGGLLRQGLVLVEVQVLGTAVVPLLLQDLLVLVLSVELPTHFVLLLESGGERILREVERLKPD